MTDHLLLTSLLQMASSHTLPDLSRMEIGTAPLTQPRSITLWLLLESISWERTIQITRLRLLSTLDGLMLVDALQMSTPWMTIQISASGMSSKKSRLSPTMERSTGRSRTPGEPLGEMVDSPTSPFSQSLKMEIAKCTSGECSMSRLKTQCLHEHLIY